MRMCNYKNLMPWRRARVYHTSLKPGKVKIQILRRQALNSNNESSNLNSSAIRVLSNYNKSAILNSLDI